MERDRISEMVTKIPESGLGSIASDKEIWEEMDGAANLKMTRHAIETSIGPNSHLHIAAMSVSGPLAERSRLIGEFSEVLGKPIDHDVMLDGIRNVEDVVIWQLKE